MELLSWKVKTCQLEGEEEVTEERKGNSSHDSFPSPACLVQAHLPHAFELHSPPFQAAAVGPVGMWVWKLSWVQPPWGETEP